MSRGNPGYQIDGARKLYDDTGDPRWAWRTIRQCINDREPFPAWVLEYLAGCADAIEQLRGDFGRGLPQALGFSGRPGRKRANELDLTTERFAMEFAKAILTGKRPATARDTASALVDGPAGKDEKELKRRLREFFGLEKLPGKNEEWRWKFIVSAWIMNHPWCLERYPDLPTIDFRGG